MRANDKILDATALSIIFVLTAANIMVLSYNTSNGYISPDSSNYLRLAERMVSGHGLFIPSNGRQGLDESWFSWWPVGYPALIAFVAWGLGVSTFLASKILNVLLLNSAVFLMYRALGREGLIAAGILLTAGTLTNYTYTWSEAPFLTALIILCLYLGGIVTGRYTVTVSVSFALVGLLIAPFLFRYIGLFAVAPASLVSIYIYTKGRRREAMLAFGASLLATTACFLYLANNIYLTGFLTGLDRIPAPETSSELLWQLTLSVGREFVFILHDWIPGDFKQDVTVVVWFIISIAIFVFSFGKGQRKSTLMASKYVYIFILIGVLYLGAIVCARWTIHADEFSSRLLDPGFALIFIGFVIWLQRFDTRFKRPLVIFFVTNFLIVSAINIYKVKLHIASGETYLENIEQARMKYADLPDDAIVVFGENELRYLRPNIRVAYPRYTPNSSYDESWSEFLSNLDFNLPIFVETGGRSKIPDRYHETVRQALQSLPANSLLLLNGAN